MQMPSEELKENVRNTFKDSLLILIYEFMGTALLTILFINTMQNQRGFVSITATGDLSPLVMGIFVLILFAGKISGSHFNPIITFGYMLGNVKQGKFDRILGFFYIAAQFCGAAVGGLFCAILMAGVENKVQLAIDEKNMGSGILGEILGSFLMVFMYLCSTDERTKFTKDAVL